MSNCRLHRRWEMKVDIAIYLFFRVGIDFYRHAHTIICVTMLEWYCIRTGMVVFTKNNNRNELMKRKCWWWQPKSHTSLERLFLNARMFHCATIKWISDTLTFLFKCNVYCNMYHFWQFIVQLVFILEYWLHYDRLNY